MQTTALTALFGHLSEGGLSLLLCVCSEFISTIKQSHLWTVVLDEKQSVVGRRACAKLVVVASNLALKIDL